MIRLFFYLVLCVLVSCQQAQEIITPDKESRIMIKIALSGDFVTLPEVPIDPTSDENSLSRNSTGDLYAIQVYSSQKPTLPYAKYAYGLFDDMSNIEIELSDRMYYRFVASLVKGGRSELKQVAAGYGDPFSIDLRPTPVGNQFIYSSLISMSGLTLGKATMAVDSKFYDRPPTDRYVGELVDFQPSVGARVEVKLKRVVFGIRLFSEDLTQGYVELLVEGAPSIFIYPESSQTEAVFTLKGSPWNNNWIEDNYAESVLCRAKWYRTGFAPQPLGPEKGRQITFKRGYRTPIKIYTTYPKFPVSVVEESEQLLDGEQEVF